MPHVYASDRRLVDLRCELAVLDLATRDHDMPSIFDIFDLDVIDDALDMFGPEGVLNELREIDKLAAAQEATALRAEIGLEVRRILEAA